MEKTKSCFTCEKLIGTNGELCPRLAAKYSKIFARGEFSFAPLLLDVLYSTCGCSEFEYNADEKSRQVMSDMHMAKAMELLKKHLGSSEDRKEQKAKNDLYATKVADMFEEFLTDQESGVLPKMAAPMVNIKNLTVNIRCINK